MNGASLIILEYLQPMDPSADEAVAYVHLHVGETESIVVTPPQ